MSQAGTAYTAEMPILAETATLVETSALQTMLEEATRKRATIAEFQRISDPIVFTTTERTSNETEFTKGQLQSSLLEIEISSNYPVMLSQPLPVPPI